MTVTILPCGPTAAMFEVADTAAAVQLAAWIRDEAIAGVVDIVPGARTVLVRCTDVPSRERAEATVGAHRSLATAVRPGPLVEIPVVYDGVDLTDVAAATGESVADVIRLHSSAVYTAAFSGFAPGFVYLTGLDRRLQLPRRASPRPRIPAGSVAIGAEFSGVYPTASPGGWHLLGTTAAALWDPARSRPAMIEPGDRVRFVVGGPSEDRSVR